MFSRSINALSIKHITNLLSKNDFLYLIVSMHVFLFFWVGDVEPELNIIGTLISKPFMS